MSTEKTTSAYHGPGKIRLAEAAVLPSSDATSSAHHSDSVRQLKHLVELVTDEDDRLSCGVQVAQALEELARLLRSEHSGRLVHDQHIDIAIQQLEDLNLLLCAHGRNAYSVIDGQVQAVAVDKRLHAPTRLGVAQRAQSPHGLGPEYHVFVNSV